MDTEKHLQSPHLSQMARNFIANDPFHLSLSLGLRNVIGSSHTETTIDDIPVPIDAMLPPTSYNRPRIPQSQEVQCGNEERDSRGRSGSPRFSSHSRTTRSSRSNSRARHQSKEGVSSSPSSGRRVRPTSRSRSPGIYLRNSRSRSRRSRSGTHGPRPCKPRTRSGSASPSRSHHQYQYQQTTTTQSPHSYRVPQSRQEEPLSSTDVNAPPLSTYVFVFFIDTLPRQVYLHLMLRLPSLYFSRVSRIFEEAEMSMPEIKKMALETASQWRDPVQDLKKGLIFEPQAISHPHANLQNSWESFIDSLMREWKTLNIISALLLSAILTILQIPAAAADPYTRYFSLLSLICALMSLLYGCMYIIRFGTMRKSYKAAEWAMEAQKSRTGIFWNVWVLLAMPAAWLAWSMILYLACIMSFVWRTGTTEDANIVPLTPQAARYSRGLISFVLAVGVIHFFLIANTFRRYGDSMDRAWQQRIVGWTQEKLGHLCDSRSFLRSETFSTPRFPSSLVVETPFKGAMTPGVHRRTSLGSTRSKPLSQLSSVRRATPAALPQEDSMVLEPAQTSPLQDCTIPSTTDMPISHSQISQSGTMIVEISSLPITPHNYIPRGHSPVPSHLHSTSFAESLGMPPVLGRPSATSNVRPKLRTRSSTSFLDNNPSLPFSNEVFRKAKVLPCRIALVKGALNGYENRQEGPEQTTEEKQSGRNMMTVPEHRNHNSLGQRPGVQEISRRQWPEENAQHPISSTYIADQDTRDGKSADKLPGIG